MKRYNLFLVLILAGSLLMAACGGSGSSGSSVNGPTGNTSGPAVTPGASGIKDASLIGSWTSADGFTIYDFKSDFSVDVTSVGATTTNSYNIVSGGNGNGKVQIGHGTTSSTYDYKVANGVLTLTSADGTSKILRQ